MPSSRLICPTAIIPRRHCLQAEILQTFDLHPFHNSLQSKPVEPFRLDFAYSHPFVPTPISRISRLLYPGSPTRGNAAHDQNLILGALSRS